MKQFLSSLSGGGSSPPSPANPTTSYIYDTTKWVIGARETNRLWVDWRANTLRASVDSGDSYPYSLLDANVAQNVNSCYMFINGNVLLVTTLDELWLTDITLSFLTQIKAKALDGVSDYDTSIAPWAKYFHFLVYNAYAKSNMVVWGNFTSVSGSAPKTLFYSKDYGQTIKAVDTWGVTVTDFNPNRMHTMEYNKYDDDWYFTPVNYGGSFYKYVYDADLDIWSGNKINFINGSASPPTTLMPIGYVFKQIEGETYIMWGGKNNENTAAERGIWRSKTSTFHDISTHERVLKFNDADAWKVLDIHVDEPSGLMLTIIREQGNFEPANRLMIAKDWGHGDWEIKQFGDLHFTRMSGDDDSGYYRLDTDNINPKQDESFFIKIGLDLFDNVGGSDFSGKSLGFNSSTQ